MFGKSICSWVLRQGDESRCVFAKEYQEEGRYSYCSCDNSLLVELSSSCDIIILQLQNPANDEKQNNLNGGYQVQIGCVEEFNRIYSEFACKENENQENAFVKKYPIAAILPFFTATSALNVLLAVTTLPPLINKSITIFPPFACFLRNSEVLGKRGAFDISQRPLFLYKVFSNVIHFYKK